MGKEEHTEVPPSLLMDDLGLTTAGQSISFFLCVKARSESKTVFGTDIPEGFLNQLQGVMLSPKDLGTSWLASQKNFRHPSPSLCVCVCG